LATVPNLRYLNVQCHRRKTAICPQGAIGGLLGKSDSSSPFGNHLHHHLHLRKQELKCADQRATAERNGQTDDLINSKWNGSFVYKRNNCSY
jgi:hypothetical protein